MDAVDSVYQSHYIEVAQGYNFLEQKMKCSFSGWGQFLQSFCRSTSEFVIPRVAKPRVLLQKLCKHCPHPEKPFSNSKTISQIKFPYRIEKLVKSQQECPGRKTLCRSLVTCTGFFCPVVLLLLLCENALFCIKVG